MKMEIESLEDWAAGFITGFALASANYPVYDELVEDFHAAKREKKRPPPEDDDLS